MHDSEWYYETGGVAYGVAVSGDYAYVADGAEGLKVIDISTPTSPSLVDNGVYDTYSAYGVTIQDSYAYIADGNSGLIIVDVSPAWVGSAPTLVGSIDTNCAFSVGLSGTYAYVADGTEGVKVIDVSNPASPRLAGGCDTYYACDIIIKDGYAYIADNDDGFRVIDIAVPGSYSVYGPIAPGTNGSAMGVDLFEDVAFVATGMAGLDIIDVFEKDSPVRITTYDAGLDDVSGVRIGGNSAVVYDGCPVAMKVLDISEPSAPTGGTVLSTAGAMSDVTVKGDYAIADLSTLKIYDISESSSIEQIGSVEISGYIAVSGDYAYTAGYNDDVNVVDISDPTGPFVVPGSNFATFGAYGIAVSGSYAYVADSWEGLKVVDISPAWDGNPSTVPALAGSCDTPNTMDVELSGDYAYVIDSVQGLVIIDISDPQNVDDDSVVFTIAESAEEIVVRGRYIYAADGTNGFKIIELGP
ncbi:MAG: hypothetical protein JXQ30_07275 [Spirochaetes bacterium]|nr:hypothetical protein [Spirochaetota bacterium]